MNNIIYYKDIYNYILLLVSPFDILNLAEVSIEFEKAMSTNKDYQDFKFLRDKYFKICINNICNHGFFNLLKYFNSKQIEHYQDTIFTVAYKQSNFGGLDFIKSYKISQKMINNAVNLANETNNMLLLDWLHKNNFNIIIDQHNVIDICYRDNIDILNWFELHNKNLYVDQVIETSIAIRSLKILNWYHDKNYITNYHDLYQMILKENNIYLLEWFTKNCMNRL